MSEKDAPTAAEIDFDRNMVVKSNDLIEGHYRMSVNAQKLAAAIISLVDPKPGQQDQGEQLPVFNFTMPELARILEIDRDNARKRLKPAMKELKNIQIEVKKPDNPGSFILLSLFRTCGYLEREGVVRFEFEERLRSYVRYLAGNFTQYQLVQIKKLRSSYSLRLYEILRKAHPIRCSRKVSVIPYELGELRGMLGVGKNTYREYTQFRRSVLERAQAEIREKTDISFVFETVRRGKKVQTIKFLVRHNPTFQETDQPIAETTILPDRYDEAVAAILSSALPELPETVVTLLASEMDAVQASQAFHNYTKAKAKANNNIRDPVAYFLKVLESVRTDDARNRRSGSDTQNTIEKLTDDSWATDVTDDWEWLQKKG